MVLFNLLLQRTHASYAGWSAEFNYQGFPTKVKHIPTAMNRMAIDGGILFP